MTLKSRIGRLEQNALACTPKEDLNQAYADGGGWRALLARKGLDLAAIDDQVRSAGCSVAEATAAQLGTTLPDFRQALDLASHSKGVG